LDCGELQSRKSLGNSVDSALVGVFVDIGVIDGPLDVIVLLTVSNVEPPKDLTDLPLVISIRLRQTPLDDWATQFQAPSVELEVGEEIFGISAALKAAPANPTINNTPATSFASHSRLRSLILQV